MNTTFKILWFEDELTWFRMEEVRIKKILNAHFLEPLIVRKNGDDFDIQELLGNDYDLILMDYKLADGRTGDIIVSQLRQNNILTDILFYSSEEETMKAAILNNTPPIDGFYLTKRNYEIFTEKVDRIITKIVKRSEDIVNLRGFVMDSSCDFEVRIHQILDTVWPKLQPEERDLLEKATLRNIKRNENRDSKIKTKVMKENPIYPVAINTKHFFAHTDFLYLLTKVIDILQKNYGLRKDEVLDNFKVNYETNISCYRNALGHKKASENCIEIVQKEFVPVDEELHQKMRINLRKYDGIIKELEDFVATKL